MSGVVFDLSTYKDKNKAFFQRTFLHASPFFKEASTQWTCQTHISHQIIRTGDGFIFYSSNFLSLYSVCQQCFVRQKHLKTKLIDQPWLITFTNGRAIQVSSASNFISDHVWQSAAVLFQSSHVKKASAQRTACSSGLEITAEIYDSRCW